MKDQKVFLSLGMCVLSASVIAQTPFRNLGFDDGQAIMTGMQNAAASVFLPGWTLKYGGVEQEFLQVNTLGTAGHPGDAILNARRFNPLGVPAERVYSLGVRNGFLPDSAEFVTWQISQTGTAIRARVKRIKTLPSDFSKNGSLLASCEKQFGRSDPVFSLVESNLLGDCPRGDPFSQPSGSSAYFVDD